MTNSEKYLKIITAGNCMMCGKEIKVPIVRGSAKFPNIFFCKECDEKINKESEEKNNK